ncbi:glycosyltransferase family 4 protein [Vibrio diabolicus]|uniref:glycosyltransferase family 4 protein n=1 Tax=Vibrio diabolicus TaxID=50719 RepID=UPI003F85DAAB
MKKVLINASNLHYGGGVQVATSFISEIAEVKHPPNIKVHVICSTSVYKNLENSVLNDNCFSSLRVIDLYGFSKPNVVDQKYFGGFDCCFSIFGPVYFSVDAKVHICGFAQPWICYGSKDVYSILPFKEKLLNKVKFYVQDKFFRKYDVLVVESESVRDALNEKKYENSIEVISNCVSSYFLNSHISEKYIEEKRSYTLGFIGRPYAHKNVRILKQVSEYLSCHSNLKFNFVFTFTDEEMSLLEFTDMPNFSTVGSLNANECVDFYENIDGLIFPSLLECFSASPLEAMATNTPIFASDRNFVRDFCGEHAFYFDPFSVSSIGQSLIEGFADIEALNLKVLEGRKVSASLITPKERAELYMDLIIQQLEKVS